MRVVVAASRAACRQSWQAVVGDEAVKLAVSESGCCAGHRCDGCRACTKGECCRRDDPSYRLPAVGSWDGPWHGALGVLADDGDKAQCHICGEFYGFLASHIRQAHGVWVDEYKAYFGLRLTQGLLGPTLRALRIAKAGDSERMRRVSMAGIEARAAITSEQRSAWQTQRLRYGVTSPQRVIEHPNHGRWGLS